MEKNLSSSTTYNGHYQLDNLPTVIYPYLFNHLHIVDQLKLKSVSKSFRSILNDCNIYELTFNDYQVFVKGNWFSTTKPIQLRYQINTSKLDVLKNPPDYLLNLRYLKIWLSSDLPFVLDDLNKFTELQILDINLNIDDESNLLQLPNLEALSINLFCWQYKKDDKLTIDAPNLHTLQLGDDLNMMNKIDFKHPLSVKHLKVALCSNQMMVFENVECLELIREPTYSSWLIPQPNQITSSGLSSIVANKFKNLKKFRYWLQPIYPPSKEERDELKNSIQYMFSPTDSLSKEEKDELKNLIRLKGDSLLVFFQGLKLKKADQLDEYDNEKILEFQLNNYDDLEDDLNLFKYVDYNELVRLLPDGQPADLFKKYSNIQQIDIKKKVEDENRLIRFIRRCNNLSDLCIFGKSLVSQQFYDQLPAISSLLRLKTRDADINFGFLKKMANLTKLGIDYYVLDNKDFNLNDLKSLKKLSIMANNSPIELTEYSEGWILEFFINSMPVSTKSKSKSLADAIKMVRMMKG